MKKELFVNLAAFLLCGTFCLSAVSKIIWWSDTILSLEKLLLSKYFAIFVSVSIIIIELAITSTIFNPRLWKYTGIFSAAIIVIFTLVVFWGRAKGRISDCPCFGNLFGAEIGIFLLIRNTILFLLSVILANRDKIQSDIFSPHQTNLRETI